MLQVKRPENGNAFIGTVITFVVALLALTMMSGSVFPSSSAKRLESQTTAEESKQTDVRELRLGAPIERQLTGGNAHSYRVTLTSGQCMKLVVGQKSIDVVVKVFGPDGNKLNEVDNDPAGGRESVSVVAEASGDYRLEVRSSNKNAIAGRYEIRIEELREATTRDRIYVAAEKLNPPRPLVKTALARRICPVR
jgi:hypothetical protein